MPRLVYDVVFEIDQSSKGNLKDQLNNLNAGGSGGTGGAQDEVNNLRNALERTSASAEEVRAGLKGISSGATSLNKAKGNVFGLQKSIGGLNRQVGSTNKQFAGANQAVFAFSDLVQDSTQFTQGFSQGMRAIGNNVAFAGELFGNLNQKVKNYNAQLSAAEKAQGKQRTLLGEVKKSMKGAAGAVIAANVAFIGFQIASKAINAQLKPLNEQAKATAEAFGEIAAEFGEFDTGAPDPFGIRSRAREIAILEDEVNKFDPDKLIEISNNIASMGQGAPMQALTALSNMLGIGQKSLFNFNAAVGAITDKQFLAVEANRELRKEVEKQRQQQKAYTRFLNSEGNEAFKSYVDLTTEYEKTLADLNARTNLSNKSIRDVFESTKLQISALRQKNTLSEGEIGLLFRLIELRKDAADELIKEREIERSTEALKDRNNQLRQEIEMSEGEAIGFGVGAGQATRADILSSRQSILQDIEKQQNEFRDRLLKDEITKEQFRTKMRKLETQKRLHIEKDAVDRVAKLNQQARDSRINAQKQVIGALKSINQQFLGDSKAFAIGILAVEKALAISEVLVDTAQKAQAARATAAVLAANPATAVFAPNALAQAGIIKATGAATAAAIAAQGLAEGAGILSGGSGAGGSSAGGNSTVNAGISGEGFRNTDLDKEPDANIGRTSSQDGDIILNLQGDLDDRAISIRAERGRKKRAGKTVRVR